MGNDLCQVIIAVAEKFMLFIKPILTPLASAFFGAWFAARIVEKRERKKREDEQVGAINVVISSMAMNYNRALSIKKQFLDEFREDAWRHIHIRPIIKIEMPRFVIDYKSISFLLEHDCRMLVQSISAAEDTLNSLVMLINKRSDMHYECVQGAFEKNSVSPNSEMTESEVIKVVGVKTNGNMKSMTDDMYDFCDAAIEMSYGVAGELSDVAIKMFPGKRILKFER